MCGLSFLLDYSGQLGPESATRMRAATVHRGPDGCGAAQFGDGGPGTVYLGHNRLAIVDESTAASQPMRTPDGRYALVYNGEIYNWRELRTELASRGVRFQTQSDTEVLLWLLVREGAACLLKLRGMFAFVFYDSLTEQALAGRDGAGIKPLFVLESTAGIAIASETGALLASGLPVPGFNHHQLGPYLQTRFSEEYWTWWDGSLFQLEPGTVQAYGLSGRGEMWRFGLTPPPVSRTTAPVLETVEQLLQQSVKRHLAADVPVGLWLSGGVDSTLLLALAREAGQRLPCFSVALSAREQSFGSADGQYARTAAAQFGAPYHEFVVSDELLLDTDAALGALSQPVADSSTLLTWWLAKQTRQEVKVVLSGAGADEWFAGYNRHQAFRWYERYRWLLRRGLPVLQTVGRRLPTAADSPLRKRLRLAQRFLAQLDSSAATTLVSFISLHPALLELLTPAARRPGGGDSFDPLEGLCQEPAISTDCLLAYDRQRYLPGDILALTDNTAMRHGLEVRTPYLDQDLMAYLHPFAAKELLRHGPKWLLRTLLDRRGGQAFTARRKEGFGLPLTRWLRLDNYQWLFDPLRRRDHPLFAHFDFERTQLFLQRFRHGPHDLGAEAWALLTLFRWYDLQRFSA